jgi:hypothetical protein
MGGGSEPLLFRFLLQLVMKRAAIVKIDYQVNDDERPFQQVFMLTTPCN